MTASPDLLRVVLPDGRVWPCAVSYSAKAQRCRLRVDACGNATLVVPHAPRRSAAALQNVLDGLSAWLGKTVDRLLGEGAVSPQPEAQAAPPEVPASISVPLCGMVWHIYVVESTGRARLREDVLGQVTDSTCHVADAHTVPAGGRLLLQGATRDADFAGACCTLLQRWLRRQANRWLPPRLRLLASRMGVDVGRITIRAQRGRWGSCSSRGDISLNCLLLLLPVPLLEHVCLHELCHRRHMDHSPRYRAHLATHAPHWHVREKSLHEAWRRMPAWARWRETR